MVCVKMSSLVSPAEMGVEEAALLVSGVTGAVSFPALLAASQVWLFKPLRLSYTPRLSSSVLGFASVTAASFGASLLALKTIHLTQDYLPHSKLRLSYSGSDVLLPAVAGVVVFRALGGRFANVLPSHLARPGAFAVEYIPAQRGSKYANPTEKELVKSMGRRHGCHSCGRKRSVVFVADHQPPSKLLGNHRNGTSMPSEVDHLIQRFYPQCVRCSQQQGAVLAGNSATASEKAIMTHFTSLRPYHLFLPLPFLFTYSKAVLQAEYAESAFVAPQVEAATQTTPPHHKETASNETSSVVKDSPVRESVVMNYVTKFPLLMVWLQLVRFLESFDNAVNAFHMTLWTFTIIAALGTI